MQKIFFTLLLISFTMTASLAEAKYCGKVNGKPIKTYGGLSCKKAISVFKAFQKGHIPKGWTCGQSVGGCGIDHKGFYFR